MTPEELEERLVDFAVRVGQVVDALPNTRLGRHVAGQLVRAGTAPAPNYAEGCAAESRRDFVHKLSIISKAKLLPATRLTDLQDETNQLCGILAASIITARRNGKSD